MKTVNEKKDNSVQIAEDKALVLTMQTGTRAESEKAFFKLYKRHKDSIRYKLLQAFKMDNDEADDNLQEVFAKVFLKINLYNPEFAVSTWIFKIASNHIIDQKRKGTIEVLNYEAMGVGRNDSHSESTPMSFQLADPSMNNLELLDKKERANQILAAINKLKSGDARNVVKKVYLEDLSYEDAAKELGLAQGTLKSLLFRAKAEIKEFLSETNIDFTPCAKKREIRKYEEVYK